MYLIRKTYIRNMSIFTQKLNPLTGKCDWEVQDENYDFHQEIARSSFADMLHDTERNKKYFLGIKAAVDKMHSMNKKANVLDIGTGTGLLSMMAVKCGADSVTAVEGFLPVAYCASEIIKANGFENKIKIIAKCSVDMKIGTPGEMEHRANILVTEIFDTELIGEGAIKTFTHAHRELLESDCIVVPSSATMYAQIVESPLANNWRKLKPIVDTDNGLPIIEIPKEIQSCVGSPAIHDIQLNQFPITHFRTIMSPTPVFRFDWSGKTKIEKERQDILDLKSENNGIAQLIFFWWDLNMDTEGKILLSCAPYWAHPDTKNLMKNSPNLPPKDVLPWRDHWMQAIYFLPQELTVSKGDPLKLISSHDEFSLWFNLKLNKDLIEPIDIKPACECGVHLVLSRTRIGQINDSTRNKKYLSTLRKIINSETVCLSLSDGSMLSLIAAKMGAKKVYSIENSTVYKKVLEEFAENNNLNTIQFHGNLKALSATDLSEVTLVISEPNFMYSLVPWDNFHFLYLLKQELSSKLTENVEIMPRKATIKAMAVNFLNLHKIKEHLGVLEGFNMNLFDKMIQDSSRKADTKVEPQPLWEYPCYALTSTFEMISFDMSNYNINIPSQVTGEINISGSGMMNGIALWVEWCLDDSPRNVISTGPIETPEIGKEVKWDMYTRQGVYLLENVKTIEPGDVLHYRIDCSESLDHIEFKFDVNNDEI